MNVLIQIDESNDFRDALRNSWSKCVLFSRDLELEMDASPSCALQVFDEDDLTRSRLFFQTEYPDSFSLEAFSVVDSGTQLIRLELPVLCRARSFSPSATYGHLEISDEFLKERHDTSIGLRNMEKNLVKRCVYL